MVVGKALIPQTPQLLERAHRIGYAPDAAPQVRLPLVGLSLRRSNDGIICPHNGRVAWFQHYSIQSPLTYLKRLFPQVSAETQDYASLWTSNGNGTDRREIGTVPITRIIAPGWTAVPRLRNLRWAQDGKGLFFDYKASAYAVPAK